MSKLSNDKAADVQIAEVNASENGKGQSAEAKPKSVEKKVKREVLIWPLFQDKSFEDRLLKGLVLFFSMLGPVILIKYTPSSPNASVFGYAFVCAGVLWGTIYLLNRAISHLLEGMNNIYKDGVVRRVSASELRSRWNRTSSADFMNAILETRLNVYFLFENNSAKILKIGFFHSSFFRQKERSNRLFDERCFFDLDEVEQIEQKYPRFAPEDERITIMRNSKIKKLEEELEKYRTVDARLGKAEKKLKSARKEGYFFANMIFEMVADPTAKKQFSHKEYKAIADSVISKDYIQNLDLSRPADTVIGEFRDNLPAEFRHEGNKAK